MNESFEIRRVDYHSKTEGEALIHLLKLYALDPMGGGEALPPWTCENLCTQLAKYPFASSFMAWQAQEPIGLVNCFETLSTFKALPLINIHDLVVHPLHRGRGVAQALIEQVQRFALQRGCCKLTLEVLSLNSKAMGLYRHLGFVPYELDKEHGQAIFLQKWL